MEIDSIPLAMLNALAFCERRFVYEFVQGENKGGEGTRSCLAPSPLVVRSGWPPTGG